MFDKIVCNNCKEKFGLQNLEQITIGYLGQHECTLCTHLIDTAHENYNVYSINDIVKVLANNVNYNINQGSYNARL
jgi:hypothetical protein